MARSAGFVGAALLCACSGGELPGGYSIEESAANREWLKRPDGSLVTPGLIENLYADREKIVLIAQEATSVGRRVGPKAFIDECFVALLIEPDGKGESQISVSNATELAEAMTEKVRHDRGCLNVPSHDLP